MRSTFSLPSLIRFPFVKCQIATLSTENGLCKFAIELLIEGQDNSNPLREHRREWLSFLGEGSLTFHEGYLPHPTMLLRRNVNPYHCGAVTVHLCISVITPPQQFLPKLLAGGGPPCTGCV